MQEKSSKTTVAYYLDRAVKEAIQKLAKENDYSFSVYVNRVLRAHIKEVSAVQKSAASVKQ